MKRTLIAAAVMLTVPSALFAQKEKEKNKEEKHGMQTITITRSGNTDDKTVIEVEGNKVKINGKDANDNKDVRVHVNNFKGTNVYSLNGTPRSYAYGFSNDGMNFFSEDEHRAMLGVVTEGNEKGAEIQSITKESAADKAGLKKGDVIIRIGSKKIETTDDVTEAVRAHKPGEKVEITYLRSGKEAKATAELGKWKGMEWNTITDMPKLNMENFRVNTAPYVFNGQSVFGRQRLGLSIQDTDDGKGVKVLDVDDDSNAAKAGIKEGDIITNIDDKAVASADEAARMFREKKDVYKVQVLRDGKTQNFEIKFPKKLKTVDL